MCARDEVSAPPQDVADLFVLAAAHGAGTAVDDPRRDDTICSATAAAGHGADA